MRRVVVTQRLTLDHATGELRECLDTRWAGLLGRAGVLPLPIPTGVDAATWLRAVGPVAGVLLTGGNDVPGPGAPAADLRRHAFEEALLAALTGVPVLGICRGCQFLAARDGFELRPVAGHVRTRHALVAEAGAGRLARFAGCEVNSFHGTGVFGAGRALVAALRAPDGSVEAVIHPAGHTAGLMWHPEREPDVSAAELEFIREFFA